ncbi:MAG: hypothetical protein NW223_15455 [Hyphomicrobiaceae bacterium]|nr:hypothetical protein [Hyphomicrobiaceae bacterium]
MQQAPSNDEVVRYLAIQAVVGVVVALAMAVAMLSIDAGGVRTLVATSNDPWIVVVFFAGAVFAIWPLVFATGVGLLSQSDP